MTKQEQVNFRNNQTRRVAALVATLSPEGLARLGGTPEQLFHEFQFIIQLLVQLYSRGGASLISPKNNKLSAHLVKGGFGVRVYYKKTGENWEVDETGTLQPQRRSRPLYTNLRGLLVAFRGWKLIVEGPTPPISHPSFVWPTTDRTEPPRFAPKAKAVVAQPAAPAAPVQPEPKAASNPFEGLTLDEPGACNPPFIPASELAAAALTDLEAMTLKELRTKATELNIAGRSKMNKAALTKAVEGALRP